MKGGLLAAFSAATLAFGVVSAQAEPEFLSKQYTRCSTCHFSPTGGGLLTPYGRSLSRNELSSTGRSAVASPPATGREHEFLMGLIGDALGPLSLGIDLRPSHLDLQYPGGSLNRDFFMNADLMAAYRAKGWTVYGEVGREPLTEGATIDSYEYWVGHESEKGLGFRAGRFLPAYGVRFADHTALNRAPLVFDKYDQILGLEMSYATQGHLLQVSVGPGRADSLYHDDGRGSFTATGRFQWDLGPRSALVVSGLFRDAATLVPRTGAGGLAFGYAPTARLNTWTEFDTQFEQGAGGTPAYTVANETAFEVYRGVWVKVSPQVRTAVADTSAGTFRLAFSLNLLPRTHWNLGASYYHDHDRATSAVTKTFLAQLHLYL